MNICARDLFLEIVDISQAERERILGDRRVSADLRAEIESLLRYDSVSGESISRRVSSAAEEALQWRSRPISPYCGPYRLVRLLGSGGMGTVYLAERRDGEIEQKVAIKLLRADADRPVWRERFLRERQLLAYLNHPSITRLLDAGHTKDGRPYLVMEYVDGVPIDEYAFTLNLRGQLQLFLLICEGVSHAHRHLIIHRDLKPSNILVDSNGHPKLLDFGIAKLLDVADEETRTVERVLTPNYASPEQVRGEVQTTATDVYSLGAVMYKLVTGSSPRELRSFERVTGQEVPHNTSSSERVNAKLPTDVECILRKALRDEPDERYESVDALADDVRAFLASKPVKARSGNICYRARKFLHRRRAAVAAVALAFVSLFVGLQAAERQREIADTRVLQVRQLVSRLLSLEEVMDGLHGSTDSMRQVVALSKDYLETLLVASGKDQGLGLELADAYSHLARAQGICMGANSQAHAQAEESLQKATTLLEPILKADPRNRKALLTAATISHDRMVLTENERRNPEAIARAREATAFLERLFRLGQPSPAEAETVSELFYDMALTHKNLHLREDAIRYVHQSIDVSRSSPNSHLRLSLGLSLLADLLRFTGDLEGALVAIREARANLENARFRSDTERRSTWSRVLGREAKILGVPGGINLNRPQEAIVPLRRAFDLVEEWTQIERDDAWSRLLFVSVGRELGDTVALFDPGKAIAVYDHSLLRVREVRDHAEARRGEAELLSASSYALRRIGRAHEAKERIETALQLLTSTKDYPTDRIVPHEATHAAIRALGDHLAETGHPHRAAEVYEDLLSKMMASQVDLENDLRHAVGLSQTYRSLARVQKRSGQRDRAAALSTLRLDMWRHWDRKLPGNVFVRRELESARNQYLR